MGAPTVLRWDDTDAPVLEGPVGSLVNLLDKCLVDGYGDKAPLGWTKDFAGTNKAVYRNDTVDGTGRFLRVDDSGASGNDNAALVQIFETMTDVDTGLGPAPADGPCYWIKSTSAAAGSRPWVLVGDKQFFYLLMCVSTTDGVIDATDYYGHFLYNCGDVISEVPGDSFAFVLAGKTYYTTSYGPMSATYGNNSEQHALRNSAGEVGAIMFENEAGSGMESATEMGDGLVAHPWHEQTLITRPTLNDGVDNTFRGFYPGLYSHCHVRSLDNLAEFTQDGKTFLPLHVYTHNDHAQVLIDLGEEFCP